MRTVNRRIVHYMLGISSVVSTSTIAADKPFTGIFEGTGRQCHGKLFIRTKTIEWHTPFAACKQTPYEILEKHFSNKNAPRIVYLLKGTKPCGFGVIKIDVNPQYPDDWNVTAYRSREDYKKQSDDTLQCNMEKVKKSSRLSP